MCFAPHRWPAAVRRGRRGRSAPAPSPSLHSDRAGARRSRAPARSECHNPTGGRPPFPDARVCDTLRCERTGGAMSAATVLVHWLHLLALALWIGALAVTQIVLPSGRRTRPEDVPLLEA